MFQISFIRAEGIEDPCEVLVQFQGKKLNGSLESVRFAIAKGVSMRINILNLNDQSTICSASFNSDLLPIDSFQWLPLSFASSDLFKKLPEDVKSPKVLVYVAYDLSPVKEISDSESEEIDAFEQEEKKNRLVTDQQNVKELEYFKGKYEEEKLLNSKLKIQLAKITQEFEEAKANARLREEFLENLISDKIKGNVLGVAEGKKQNYCEGDKENVQVKSLVGGQKEKCRSLNSKKKVNTDRFDRANPTMTHLALQSYMKKKKNLGMFVRDSGNLYQFGNKKIFITLKNNALLCRVGGGFEDLDEFVKKVTTKDNHHKRAHTVSASSLLH